MEESIHEAESIPTETQVPIATTDDCNIEVEDDVESVSSQGSGSGKVALPNEPINAMSDDTPAVLASEQLTEEEQYRQRMAEQRQKVLEEQQRIKDEADRVAKERKEKQDMIRQAREKILREAE